MSMTRARSAIDSVPAAALTRWLRELPDCVILRNEEGLVGNLQRGGDIDVLVRDPWLAERTLIHHLGPPVRIIRSSYVRGYSYDWGGIDVLPTLEWRGACYLAADAVIEGRSFSARGLPVPRIAHEAVISWLSSVLFGGFFNARYAATIRQAIAADGTAFRQALRGAAGPTWGDRLWQAAVDGNPEVSATWTPSLRRAVWWRAWRRAPVRTIKRALAFVLGELRLRIAPPVPCLAIVGPRDGQTSRVTDAIVERFAGCPYGSVKAFRSPPPLGTPAAGMAKWPIAYWTRLVHLRAKGYILALDGPPLAYPWAWLLPKPELVFTLSKRPDVQPRGLPAAPTRETGGVRPAVGAVSAAYVLSSRLPTATLAEQVQYVVRDWLLDRSAASARAESTREDGAP
jgi:hypothetical protein